MLAWLRCDYSDVDPVTEFGLQVKEKTDVKVLGGNRMVAVPEE